jgi:3(or 17)beta-hydroxysteroid dehydrogenase
MGRLAQKVAWITGGASGIGLAIARRLHSEGARVLVGDVDEAAGSAAAAELGEGARFVSQDVTSEARWREAADELLEREGRLDVLVNNAGIGLTRNGIEDTSLEDFRRIHAVNLEGVFLGVREAIRVMKPPAAGGSIVNISSVAGIIGDPSLVAYCSSKGAVRSLTKATALHCALKGYGIRVNSVHPCYVKTPLSEAMIDSSPDPAKVRAALVRSIPMRRLATVEDVAGVVLFLASEDSSFVTGSEQMVDGGLTAW